MTHLSNLLITIVFGIALFLSILTLYCILDITLNRKNIIKLHSLEELIDWQGKTSFFMFVTSMFWSILFYLLH